MIACSQSNPDPTPGPGPGPGPVPGPIPSTDPCTITNPISGAHYDFSSLRRTTANWVLAGTSGYKFLINICGSLVTSDSNFGNCDASSGACQQSITSGSAWSMGVPTTSLFFSNDVNDASSADVINLLYEGGSSCHNNQYNRSTLISFTCKRDGPSSSFKFITETPECRYVFQWETPLACNGEDVIGDDGCQVKDPATNNVYDLSSLTKSVGGYSFVDSSYNYTLNVCGPLNGLGMFCSDSKTAACQQSLADNRVYKLGQYTSALEINNGVLSLTYTSGDFCHGSSARSVVIYFTCAKGVVGSPVFETETSGCSYVFRWATDAACSVSTPDTDTIQCTLSDSSNGNAYDLSPLTRSSGNWEALDTREGFAFKYLINVCRPINPVAAGAVGSKCSSLAGACQASSADATKAYSLGSPAAPKLRNGLVSLEYNLGAPCHQNAYNRSLLISFTCAQGSLGAPVFVTETAVCQYIFNWATYAACPTNTGGGGGGSDGGNGTVGNACRVTDPISNTVYDLSSLTSSSGFYSTSATPDGYVYQLNVCGGISGSTRSCGTTAGVGVCQTKPGDSAFNSKIAGYSNSKLTYSSSGVLTLTYTGGSSCHDNQYNRSAVISFTCARGVVGSPVFLTETGECSYLFTWATDAACPPSNDQIECVATDPATNIQYDLSGLSRSSGNWEALDTREGYSFRYFINICHAINPVTDSSCPVTAGACQANSNDLTKAYSLGRPSAPEFSDGSLKIRYDLGTPCHQNAYNRSMLIMFTCKKETLGVPKFISETPECQYIFMWETSAACAPSNGTSTDDCKVLNPTTNTLYDLTSLTLTGQNYKVATDDGYVYELNVCGALTSSSPCLAKNPKASSCQTKPSDPTFAKVSGTVSRKLTYSSNTITLRYDGGAACHDSQFNRSTIILFTCSPGVVGTPQFVQEYDNCTYLFTWATDAACSGEETPIECIARNPNTGVQYDLSPLIKTTGNWEALDNPSSPSYKYLINVCHALNPVSNAKCSTKAGACQTSPTNPAVGYDLGLPAAPVHTGTSLTLTYELGTYCHNNTYPRSMLITFTCKPGSLGNPTFITETSQCQYVFQWETSVACDASNGTVSTGCSVRNPLTNNLYDFSGLSNPSGYSVSGGGYIYKLNVCGALSAPCGTQTGVIGCQTSPTDSTFNRYTGLASASSLTFNNGLITLQYTQGQSCKNNAYNRTTIITFTCARGVTGAPVFVQETADCIYVFTWATDAACSPTDSISCLLSDPVTSVQYDLSVLTKTTGNWEAVDTRQGYAYRYLLNVCHTINPSTETGSCNARGGGCQLSSTNSSKSYNLGFVSSPTISSSGAISLLYDSGSSCHQNAFNRSMFISFTCKKDSLGVPHFIDETPDCRYIFNWETSAACAPTSANGTSGDCTITNSQTGDVYDFNSLTLSSSDYSVAAGDYVYKLNICGAISTACGSTASGVGVCQTKPGDSTFNPKNAGLATRTLEYKNGVISLTYTSGSACHDSQFNRSTVIIFTCARGVVGAPVFVQETANCSYVFTWATDAACTAGDSIECLARDPATGAQFDLSPLAKSTGNWEAVDTSTGGSFKYYINVCRPLNPVTGSTCPAQAGACQTELNDATHAWSLGRPAGPKYENGALTLRYDLGTPCHQNAFNRSMLITFVCKRESYGVPKYITETADCQYVFVWESSVACTASNGTSQDDCTVVDSLTNNVYDLSSLSSSTKDYSVTGSDGFTYSFNICRDLVDHSKCKGSTTASCQTSASDASFAKNTGVVSKTIQYNGGSLSLKYTNGDPCHNNQFNRSTLISFSCARGQVGTPTFVSETSDCSYLFNWATDAACPPSETIACVASDPATGAQYDLSPLIKTTGNWEALDTTQTSTATYKYLINVCHALNPVVNTNCGARSGACQTKLANDTFGHGLGLPAAPAFANGQLSLRYNLGSSCHQGAYNRSMLITFSCKKDTLGVPKFISETADCTYIFNWETSAACAVSNGTVTPDGDDCKVTDPLTNNVFDLTSLTSSTKDYSVVAGDYTYKLNVCSKLNSMSPCTLANTAVCQTRPSDPNFANSAGVSSRKISYNNGVITLKYSSGSPCHNNQFNRSTVITFTCARGVVGAPVFVQETLDCSYIFTWATDAACTPGDSIECLATDSTNGLQYDLSSLVRTSGNWEALDTRENGKFKYYINVCHAINPVSSTKCDSKAGGCQTSPSDPTFTDYSLGRPSAPFVANGTVVLQYSSGSPCHQGAYNRSLLIKFKCKKDTVGTPVFISETDSCQYIFLWETAAVCPPSNGTVGADCQIADPLTGSVYNLKALSRDYADYSIPVSGYNYTINICRSLVGTCHGDPLASACRFPTTSTPAASGVVFGQVSTVPVFANGQLSLNMSNGEACGNGGRRSVIISFSCRRGVLGQPVFVTLDACTTYLRWETSAACGPDVDAGSCTAHDSATGFDYNLGVLARTESAWIPTSSSSSVSTRFILNVCGKAVGCPDGSASCAVNNDLVIDLGAASNSLAVTGSGKLTLTYSNNQLCIGTTYYTTKIDFECSLGVLGNPVFTGITNSCTYNFKWLTSAACPVTA